MGQGYFVILDLHGHDPVFVPYQLYLITLEPDFRFHGFSLIRRICQDLKTFQQTQKAIACSVCAALDHFGRLLLQKYRPESKSHFLRKLLQGFTKGLFLGNQLNRFYFLLLVCFLYLFLKLICDLLCEASIHSKALEFTTHIQLP